MSTDEYGDAARAAARFGAAVPPGSPTVQKFPSFPRRNTLTIRKETDILERVLPFRRPMAAFAAPRELAGGREECDCLQAYDSFDAQHNA